jgi:hypothetical protein
MICGTSFRIVVPESDHMIPFEPPASVISAIHEVWLAARQTDR